MRIRLSLAVGAVMLIAAVPAAAKDYASTALNIIPAGTKQTPSAPGAKSEAEMYNGLTPLFRNVSPSDLTKYFKSEALAPAVVDSTETIPERPGVTIKRDNFGVPHVYGKTNADVTWGAGWVIANDQTLLLLQARYNGLLAAIDAPGISAIGLITNLANFKPSAQTNAIVAKQTQAILANGSKGRQLLNDIDVYLQGINAWFAKNQPSTPKFTRNDIYSLNAIKGQFLGEGGGNEPANTQFFQGLQARFGSSTGNKVWTDLRARNDKDTTTTLTGTSFNYSPLPKQRTGNVIIRNGSLDTSAASAIKAQKASRQKASNVLLVSGSRTSTGHPLFVGGPQIGYFFPGLTLEIGLHGPNIDVRGATSAPFPGYMLIGRGQDYAWTLTSAGADIIDTYAETLCGGSKTKYLYKGTCRSMGTVDAGALTQGGKTTEVTFKTTVHGSVIGYAKTTSGKTVALSRKRSSYGKDTVDQLFFQQMTFGRVHNVKQFFNAAALTPQTFNSFYADDKNTGVYTSGALPIRAPGVDGDLLTDGRGGFEWRGFAKPSAHPQGSNPSNGLIVNWNNKPVPGFPAGDDRFGNEGSVQRVQMLNTELARRSRHTLATVTGAMNAAATQDVRSVVFEPVLEQMLKQTSAPSGRDNQMRIQLRNWHNQGSSRLDLNNDGKIDAPGAAIMDAAWTGLANAAMCGRLGTALCDQLSTLQSRFDTPPGGQYSGWHQYMNKDFRTLLGQSVKQRFNVRYCGNGNVNACSQALWKAIDAAGDKLQAAQGANPAAWRESAVPEQIQFRPLPLITMRYTNRPSGIQQVISFFGHGPRS